MPTPGTPCWMHITFVLCRRRRPGSDPQTECCWACPENNLQLTRFASDPPRSAKMGIKQHTCLKTGTTQTQKHPARKGRSCHQHVIFSFLKFVKVIWKETFFLCYFAFLCLPSIHISWLFLLYQLIKGLFLQLDFFIYHAV